MTAVRNAPREAEAGPLGSGPPRDQRLLARLKERGKIGDADIARLQRVRGEDAASESLARLLSKLELVASEDVAEALADIHGLPLAAPSDYPDGPLLADLLPRRFLREHLVVPIAETPEQVVLAMVDPHDRYAADAAALALTRTIVPWVGARTDIERLLDSADEGEAGNSGAETDEAERDEDASVEDVAHLRDLASEAPVIRLVNRLLQRAFAAGASDLHIEPFDGALRIRYRIDGMLQEGDVPAGAPAAAVISRIKIMARLDIAERRLPQDGRMRLRLQGNDIDVRISTVPTLYGESVVLRLLRRESVRFDLADLGFAPPLVTSLRQLLALPHGMLLVTGPTGSGKTTTLYAALNVLNTCERKLITVEDPVEYQLDGVNQIQVKPAIGLTFAGALRSIVRQDPDVIMVGETRDAETARMCVQSALTGHLVLSTLHTNDAVSAVTRLLEMGVEGYLLAATLNGVIAQRLGRVLCRHCRMPDAQAAVALKGAATSGASRAYRRVGCAHCNGTGYTGRKAIVELLLMNDVLRSLVLEGADVDRLRCAAVEHGMSGLYRDGLSKVADGVTSFDEVLRVTRET